MQIDIKAKTIKPIRKTYTHVANRIGEGKTASRYQEAVYDLQATENFHYRPTWQPDKEIYDETRTSLKMSDWYKFLDPRQFYYGNYVIARAKQQDSTDSNFKFVEKRSLLATLPEETKQLVQNFIIPLRHFEWGANMNNFQICAMGYGASITSAASLHGADRLGNAQYITRIGLAISENDTSTIDTAKNDWINKDIWQGLRKVVEDSLVVEDWFELFVAQNLVMDGFIFPLFFQHFDQKMNAMGATSYTMLTEFTVDWYSESLRWVDKQIAVATAESDANKELVTNWFNHWLEEAEKAIAPLANAAFDNGSEVLAEVKQSLILRAKKNGLSL